jgi:hypothetical protein
MKRNQQIKMNSSALFLLFLTKNSMINTDNIGRAAYYVIMNASNTLEINVDIRSKIDESTEINSTL